MYFFEFRSINCPCHYWILYDFHIFIFFLWTHRKISAPNIVQWSKGILNLLKIRVSSFWKRDNQEIKNGMNLCLQKLHKNTNIVHISYKLYTISIPFEGEITKKFKMLWICVFKNCTKIPISFAYIQFCPNHGPQTGNGDRIWKFEGVRESLKMISKVWVCN